MIRQARTVAGIDLNVMIRPRGGDFLFNDDEFAAMRADIETAKAEGAERRRYRPVDGGGRNRRRAERASWLRLPGRSP